jgi:hypothetical protein
MKRYINKQREQWYNDGEPITLTLDDGSVFSGFPTEEQLQQWGFEEWEPTPAPELSEEEQVREEYRERMRAIEEELRSMDYLTSKYVDGEDMTQYGDWQSRRRLLREEYRQIEALLAEEE